MSTTNIFKKKTLLFNNLQFTKMKIAARMTQQPHKHTRILSIQINVKTIASFARQFKIDEKAYS